MGKKRNVLLAALILSTLLPGCEREKAQEAPLQVCISPIQDGKREDVRPSLHENKLGDETCLPVDVAPRPGDKIVVSPGLHQSAAPPQ